VYQLPPRGRQNIHRRIPLVVRWPGNLKNLGRPAPAMRNFSVGLCLSYGRENLVVESLGSSAGAGVENLTPLFELRPTDPAVVRRRRGGGVVGARRPPVLRTAQEPTLQNNEGGPLRRPRSRGACRPPRSRSRNPHGGPGGMGASRDGMPLDDDHLPAGLTQLADLPPQNDEGVILNP
jgi:hypothetical protein